MGMGMGGQRTSPKPYPRPSQLVDPNIGGKKKTLKGWMSEPWMSTPGMSLDIAPTTSAAYRLLLPLLHTGCYCLYYIQAATPSTTGCYCLCCIKAATASTTGCCYIQAATASAAGCYYLRYMLQQPQSATANVPRRSLLQPTAQWILPDVCVDTGRGRGP